MLQSIQNRAARIVVGAHKFDNITPVLRELHWLTVDKRILFKIAVFMYKCINDIAPAYLCDKFRFQSKSERSDPNSRVF